MRGSRGARRLTFGTTNQTIVGTRARMQSRPRRIGRAVADDVCIRAGTLDPSQIV